MHDARNQPPPKDGQAAPHHLPRTVAKSLVHADKASCTRDLGAISRMLASDGGHVHLLGIAGVGMAGLARLLQAAGFTVSGCDVLENNRVSWLRKSGIDVVRGHDVAHIDSSVDWIVRSTAVPDKHPEILRGREAGIPCFRRGMVFSALANKRRSIAVSGTHGKTTTSNLITQMLQRAGMDPGYGIGAEIPGLDGTAAPGGKDLLVIEADESDGTVVYYRPSVAVVTNIEYDHMEHFENELEFNACFEKFVRQARERVIWCGDDPVTAALCRPLPNGLSYGFAPDATVRGQILNESGDAVECEVAFEGEAKGRIRLPVPGHHNMLNALGACAVGYHLGLDFQHIRAGLEAYRPALRRFQTVCSYRGVRVISDYAHHPTEIRGVIETAGRIPARRRIAIYQPHRYTRTRALLNDFPPAFNGLDELILAPVYAASESPLSGGTSEDLYGAFADSSNMSVRLVSSLEEGWEYLQSTLESDDLLLVMGAGDVEEIANWAKHEATRLPLGEA